MTDPEVIAVEIAEALNKGYDIPFRRRMAESVIQVRATILKQQYDRDGRFPSGTEDSITLPMKDVPTSECLNEDIECEVFRTIDKIPRPIRKNRTTIPFAFVGSSNSEVSFIHIRPEEVRSFLEGNKFIKDSPLFAYYNDYIYTFNHSSSKITIRDVFADPRELLVLKGCDGNPCKSNVDIDEDMKRLIKMMIFEEIRQFNRPPEDKTIKINEQA